MPPAAGSAAAQNGSSAHARALRPIKPQPGTSILLAVAIGYAGWNLLGPDDRLLQATASSTTYFLLLTAGWLLAWRRARLTRDPWSRQGWVYFGTGLLAYTIGCLVWAYVGLILDLPPFPSAADLFFVAAQPCLIAGILLLSGPPLDRRERTYLLLDALVVLIAGLVVVGVLMGPLYISERGDSVLVRILAVYYPVAALGACAAAAFAFLRRPDPAHERTLRPLLVGTTLFAIGQMLFSYISVAGTHATGHWLNIFLVTGNSLVTVAMLQPLPDADADADMSPDGQGGTRAGGWVLPYAAGAALFVLLFASLARDGAGVALYAIGAGLALTTGLIAVRRRIIDRENEQLRARLAHQAYHDALTGLPNRAQFLGRLERALRRQRPAAGRIAVLFLDLDGFKGVNDRLGHVAGDRLLVNVSRRLAGALRDGDLLARLGGDEFVVLMLNVGAAVEATTVAERLIASVAAPLSLDGVAVQVGASAGVAICVPGAVGVDAVLRSADAAMYRAKVAGRGGYALIDAA